MSPTTQFYLASLASHSCTTKNLLSNFLIQIISYCTLNPYGVQSFFLFISPG